MFLSVYTEFTHKIASSAAWLSQFTLGVLLFLCCSCVGTVQTTDQNATNVIDTAKPPLSFTGITSASAISDSKMEVFFYPATGGSGEYTYDIIVGSSPFPISIPSDVLTPDYRGLLRTTISGLSRLSTYIVKVEVRDPSSDTQSDSGVTKTVTTFDNEVADFNGISSAANTPGQDGKDSLKIRWTPARTSGGLSSQDWDPRSYEVVLVDAERLTPGDMDIANGPAEGKWVYQFNHDSAVNEYIVRGLPSRTRFYVRMRALHEKSLDDVYNPRKRSELNTKYVTITTLSDDLADLDFQPASFAVSLAPGEQGLNAINTSWTQATGVFDHFRIYYGLEGGGVTSGALPANCLAPLLSPVGSTVFCKKADFNLTNAPVTGLIPYSNYEVVLVLCQTVNCSPAERIISTVRTITTDPNSPIFTGLKSIDLALNLEDVGTLSLNYETPNFTTGYFDGLIIKMRRTLDGSDPEMEVTSITNTVSHHPYNFLSTNKITIVGVNYLADEPYCFTIYPFKWDSNGITKRESPNAIWKCVQPKIEAPTALEFPGLTSAISSQTTVTLNWSVPTGGIYSHYELFWRKQSIEFSWGEAISQAAGNFNYTNYGRLLFESDETSLTLDGFPNGAYTFGLITYYNYVSDDGVVLMRSETNGNILRCNVDNASILDITCTP